MFSRFTAHIRLFCAPLAALMTLPIILVAALFPVAALAANNWTEACHAGECQWDLQSTHGSGTMLLVNFVFFPGHCNRS